MASDWGSQWTGEEGSPPGAVGFNLGVLFSGSIFAAPALIELEDSGGNIGEPAWYACSYVSAKPDDIPIEADTFTLNTTPVDPATIDPLGDNILLVTDCEGSINYDIQITDISPPELSPDSGVNNSAGSYAYTSLRTTILAPFGAVDAFIVVHNDSGAAVDYDIRLTSIVPAELTPDAAAVNATLADGGVDYYSLSLGGVNRQLTVANNTVDFLAVAVTTIYDGGYFSFDNYAADTFSGALRGYWSYINSLIIAVANDTGGVVNYDIQVSTW